MAECVKPLPGNDKLIGGPQLIVIRLHQASLDGGAKCKLRRKF